ncbi:MAG: late competence development ComFB family protein [Firmicutes bacterium]|nr:late competence development ComFB family protein [Bacillota bacterium]
MTVYNQILDEIKHQLETYLSQNPEVLACQCQQCRNDIVALAANRLPSKYTASREGRLLTGVELQSKQAQLDVFKAIVEATKQVNNSPRHPGRKVMP